MSLARLLRDRMRMLREDAVAVSRVVESAFKGRDAVEDEELDAQLRQVFYDLQDAKVLEVERHEYERDGRLLRGYKWHIATGEVTRDEVTPLLVEDPTAELYHHLRPRHWERRPVDRRQW